MTKKEELEFWKSLPDGESVIIEFLGSKKDFTAPYNEVAKELVAKDVLGFGVEPIEIVWEAEKNKIIIFDRQTQKMELRYVDMSVFKPVFDHQTQEIKLVNLRIRRKK